jgi:hypothetical protein
MEVLEESVARLRILAAAALAVVDKAKDDAMAIKEVVDTVFSVGEAFETPDSEQNIRRDMIAVGLLRRGGVERTMRAEKPSISGKNITATERTLHTTHAHLFKKRYKKR